jgi:hypothetical protein
MIVKHIYLRNCHKISSKCLYFRFFIFVSKKNTFRELRCSVVSTQQVVVISYRHFGKTYRFHMQGTLKMGQIGCPIMLARNYHYTLRNNPRRAQFSSTSWQKPKIKQAYFTFNCNDISFLFVCFLPKWRSSSRDELINSLLIIVCVLCH